jgi:hypothetical protein
MGLLSRLFASQESRPPANRGPFERALVEPSRLTGGPRFVIALWGPAAAGKATLLHQLEALRSGGGALEIGKLISAAPRTAGLTVDSSPEDWAASGMHLFIDLRFRDMPGSPIFRFATVPGLVERDAARRELAAIADAVVFVGDAQRERADANDDALADLARFVTTGDRTLDDLPGTVAVTKLDLLSVTERAEHVELVGYTTQALPWRVMADDDGRPFHPALKEILKLVLTAHHQGAVPRATQLG